MHVMPKKLDPELGARAVRLMLWHRAEYPTKYRGGAGGFQAGRGRQKSLWRWVAQAEIDGGEAPGVTIEENEENRRLREEAILKAARTFFGELDLCNG
jgi:transposase